MFPSASLLSHGSPRLERPGMFGIVPPSVHVAPPSFEYEYPLRSAPGVRKSSPCCESLKPTATCDPATAMVVSLCVVWSV